MSRGFDVGTLRAAEGGTVFLTIGYHQLDGKVMDLKKPLLLLERREEGEVMGEDEAEAPPGYKASRAPVRTGFTRGAFSCPNLLRQVVGVLRKKYLFKNRPRALISKPEQLKRP